MAYDTKYIRGNQFPFGFYCYETEEIARMEDDWTYFRSLLPKELEPLQLCIIEECDKLEYKGSVLFDEYPDKEYLTSISRTVIDSCSGSMEGDIPEALILSLLMYEILHRRFRFRHHEAMRRYQQGE